MASEVVCESRIESVTVYARGAVVRRSVTLPEVLPEGACDVVVGRVTALADAGSLRATAAGGREVLGIRAKLVVPEAPPVDASLAGKVDDLRRKRDDLLTERNHAGWRRDVLASVQPEPDLARRVLAIDPAERIQDALAIVGLVAEEMTELDAKIAELTLAVEKNERESEALKIAAAQASAAQSAGAPPELSLIVQLGPLKGGEAQALDVEYAVLAARWWPAYRARFTDAATRVALTLSAFVAQASGEDWTSVALTLSTGDLLRDARLPEVASLRLGRAQKPRPRGYRPPPEGLDAMFEGFDRFVVETTIVTSATTTITAHRAVSVPGWSPGIPAPYAEFQAHDDELDSPTRVTQLEELSKSKRPAKPRPAAGAPPGYGGAPPHGGFGGAASPASAAEYASMVATRDGGRPFANAPGGVSKPMAPPPMQQPAPARSGSVLMSLGAAKEEAGGMADLGALEEGTLGGGAFAAGSLPIEPADAWLDFDSLWIDPAAPRDRRGRLARETGLSAARSEAAAQSIERMEAPGGTIDPRASRGLFDVIYRTAGTTDVPSSNRPHRISVVTAEASAAPRFVTVPREAPEVYRRADITNPFGVPLLTGPVEVLIDGALVALTRLSYTDRGGQISIGLGVEERIRVARNSRVEEGSAGLLGGSTTVDHTVTTDLSSSLGRAVRVEIIDRIPASDDKDVDIKVLASQPPSSPYTQAELGQPVRKGLKWEVEVPAGGKAKAEWRYRVTLPSKMEIVGGNRRE